MIRRQLMKKSIFFWKVILTDFLTEFFDTSHQQLCTANIFEVIFTVFNCVPISTVISLYGLHLIAAPSTVKKL